MTPAVLSAVLTAVLVLALPALAAGLALALAARRLARDDGSIADAVDALLPQTQCGQCGYPGCRPYAEAIARGDAPINRCPPGGEATIAAIAELLGREPLPVDPELGPAAPGRVAFIDEARCIGCALCLKACPVDAIVGAQHYMHTVIESECTGCELCVAPCPVDCIDMAPATGGADPRRHPIDHPSGHPNDHPNRRLDPVSLGGASGREDDRRCDRRSTCRERNERGSPASGPLAHRRADGSPGGAPRPRAAARR